MQELKNSFDELSKIIPDFKIVSLNKSSFKQYTNFVQTYTNQGVRSDFVKIFKIKYNQNDAYKVGFSFTYINLEKDDWTIYTSISTQENQNLYSKKITFVEFKEKFNKLLSEYKDKQISGKENNLLFVQSLHEAFNIPKFSNNQIKKKNF